MNTEPRKPNVGRDAVVMGNVSGDVGDGSVVLGPTDDRGNVILNQQMAVGRGAFAGPDSIAIGAGAGAGSRAQLPYLVNQLASAVKATNDPRIADQFTGFVAQLNGDRQSVSSARTILQQLRNAAVLEGVWSLIDRIGEIISA